MQIKESEYMEYGHDDDYSDDDPGNLLRAKLSGIPVDSDIYDKVRDLIYTADERHILENGIDFYDALTIYRLFVLAQGLTEEEIEDFSM